ncbi:acetyltransferase [Streptomyces sp. NPDC093018]
MYEGWGYRTVGETQPHDDSPLYSGMVRQL